MNSSESEAQTQIGNPPLLLVGPLLAHGCLPENVICMAEVSHDVTVFSDTALCQFTQMVRWLDYQKITLWNLFSNVCGFRGASTLLCCVKEIAFYVKICTP